jgi:hypothetical protein
VTIEELRTGMVVGLQVRRYVSLLTKDGKIVAAPPGPLLVLDVERTEEYIVATFLSSNEIVGTRTSYFNVMFEEYEVLV